MASKGQKRALPSKGPTKQSTKRRKLTAATPVKADALAWKSATMPDRLDDYEGFFGLEEVEDVDVVKDESTGQITFAAKSTAATSQPSKSEGADSKDYTGATSKNPPENEHDPPDWEGLSSEDEEEVDASAWRSLNLSSTTISALSKLKFTTPTPIQTAAIPEILAGHDVIGKASTGSGKTLAFGIPIFEEFLERRRLHPKGVKQGDATPQLALILSPTRELANQLHKHLTALCSGGTSGAPVIATLTGGLSVQKQRRILKDADIVIGTPGRLWEVISDGQGVIRALQGIQFLVVDEADRLLSEGHFKEVEEILNALDRKEVDDDQTEDTSTNQSAIPATKRQTLVFSATFDRNLQRKLANKSKPSSNDLLTNKQSLEYLLTKLNFREPKPKFIDVNPINQLAQNLKEGIIECSGTEKDLYLYTLLLLHPNTRTLVFTNSISAVRRLTPLLQNLNLPALPLHSGMPQKARLRSVERFTSPNTSKNSASILVATDVAARGLDIPNVQLVIHYHLPRAADTYVHRSGRTARAGQPGSSIIICSPEEAASVRRLVAKVHASSASTLTEEDTAKRQGYYIRTLDLDRRIVSRLKPRATLAKKIADVELAKQKGAKEDTFLRAAAEELGVDYTSSENESSKGKRGRGTNRKKKESEMRGLGKKEIGAMKAELKGMLTKRVNVGVSERYLTSGGVDVNALLAQKGTNGNGTEFLGGVQDLGL